MLPRLHVVTDDAVLTSPGFRSRAAAVLEAGAHRVALHVRGPHTSGRVVYEAAKGLRDIAADTRSLLVINDRVDVALALRLEAVHLGRRSLPAAAALDLLGGGGRVGASAHNVAEVAEAEGEGASWTFVGNVFETLSHPGQEGGGVALVAASAAASKSTPVLAIGGVDELRVRELRVAGAYGVAVIGGVWRDPHPPAAVSRYLVALAMGAGTETGTL